MRIVSPTPDGIAQAAAVIAAGEVVAYPTETVYGLGADPFNEFAVRKLFETKGRPAANPVLLIIADADQLAEVVSHISDRARACIECFWPGPLSLVLPRSPRVPDIVTAGGDTVCVRCPANETARALCRAVGHAITSTSANLSGEAPALSLDALDLAGIALAIDGGTLAPSPPSTVYDPDTARILRPGVITEDELRTALER